MADKKKMSVADILAAARKTDSGGTPSSSTPTPEQDESATEAQDGATAPSTDTPPPTKPAQSAKPAKAASSSGGRPSVADMLAMARGKKSGGADKPKPAAKAAKPGAKKSAPAASGAKPKPKPAGAQGTAAPSSGGPRDTASILAAARKESKPGPIDKATAAKLKSTAPTAKKSVELPPMPIRPASIPSPATGRKPAAKASAGGDDRRGFLTIGFAALGAVSALWALATARFMFPNVLREPPSKFKVGFPGDFPPGSVATKFKAQYAVWIVNTEFNGEPQIAALKTVCTHLGCTPNWLEAEQKFKCPCHGSGFYKEGINFEGPAPRPLERYAIHIADDGQIEIDKSRIFQEEMGQWADSASFIPA